MSGRRVKRLGEGNSALIHQLLAEILALMDNLPLYALRLADGCVMTRNTVHPIALYPAADANCVTTWSGIMPKGWTAMTNPTLVIYVLSAGGVDTWSVTVQADASGAGEDGATANLYNAGTSFTTTIDGSWKRLTISLTGTISPGDIVSVEIQKTSADVLNMHIATTIWIER